MVRELDASQRLGGKAEKCPMGTGEQNDGRHMEGQEAGIMDYREQTKVEDILAKIKKKKWAWEGHIMRKTNNR